ncbi:MAG: class I SAM-dependent methyltransferase [Gallionella sp.]
MGEMNECWNVRTDPVTRHNSDLSHVHSMVHPERTSTVSHRQYDEKYTEGRRNLWNDIVWRQGPERVYDVSSQAVSGFARYGASGEGGSYLEIGSGPYHPLGVTTIMYLNGLTPSIAFDRSGTNTRRAAEALYDLLAACALEPQRWNMTGQDPQQFLERIYSFNIPALKQGDLHRGVVQTGLEYIIGDLQATPLADESISFASSRATLEHIADFRGGMSEMYRILKPGGISVHSIDLADHRVYRDRNGYNMWSFLQEDERWSDGLCNRLRAHEIVDIASSVGFTVEVLEVERGEIPPETFGKLHSKYAAMGRDKVEITSMVCVFRK